jgi:ABC-2 type transport system permease protein
VQALGQCLFLPMILIGGVGIPLAVLPVWAQRVAGFMPGRYAVEALQQGFAPDGADRPVGFAFLALAVIGAAAALAGAKLFRWDHARTVAGPARGWVAAALLAWGAIGVTAAWTGRLRPVIPEAAAWETITAEQVARITYDELPADNEIVTRLAPPWSGPPPAGRLADFARRLEDWRPGRVDNAGQAIRNLVCVASISDLSQEPQEGEIARIVFARLRSRFAPEDLRRALAWVVLAPDEGSVVRYAPELGLPRHPPERAIRQRNVLYARKFLGRLTGGIAVP